MKTIAETAWLQNWALSVNRNLDPEFRETVRQAVLDLDEDGIVSETLGLRGFRPATDAEYDVVRSLIAEEP